MLQTRFLFGVFHFGFGMKMCFCFGFGMKEDTNKEIQERRRRREEEGELDDIYRYNLPIFPLVISDKFFLR